MHTNHTPRQILESDALSRADKIEVLKKLAYDENARAVAQQEGMGLSAPPPEPRGITVREALTKLGAERCCTDTMHGSI